MNEEMPRRVAVDSKKVAEHVFDKIFPVIQGVREDEAVLALICAAILVQRPNCPHKKLQHVTLETTGYLVNLLAEEVPVGQAN